MLPLGLLLGAMPGQQAPGELSRWGWHNIVEADAGLITVTGLGAVFAGLAGLCLFMLALGALNRLLERGAEQPLPAVEPPAAPPAPLSAPLPAPPPPAPLVPFSLLAAAQLGLHMFTENRLKLGDPAVVRVDGAERRVVLLAVGPVNRALVDGEQVVFTSWRVAPGDPGAKG